MKIGFIGMGKAGGSLMRYFADCGIEISGYCSRSKKNCKFKYFDTYSELCCVSDIIFITTPDSVISDIWHSVRNDFSGIICHCSGALDTGIFDGYKNSCSVHPLLAISSAHTSYEQLHNAFFTLEGNQSSVKTITSLLDKCGNHYCVIDKKDKIKYHAAACFASNFVISMCSKAQELLIECGFAPELVQTALIPIMSANMNNICAKGTIQSLTGPVERNDSTTIKKHLDVLDSDTRVLYKSAASELLKLARKKHPDTDFSKTEQLLKD